MDSVDTTLLWLQTTLFGAVLYWIAFFYISLYEKGFFLSAMSEAFALSGGILIGFSFALSGLGYFLNVFDTKLKYRKMLGVVGYLFALIYSSTLVLLDSERYGSYLLEHILDIDILLGLIAMIIFTVMFLISFPWAIRTLGRHWRPVLRLGYIAFVLLIIRALFIEGMIWRAWISMPIALPPPRFLLSIFALSVIYLRFALEIGIRQKKKRTPSS